MPQLAEFEWLGQHEIDMPPSPTVSENFDVT